MASRGPIKDNKPITKFFWKMPKIIRISPINPPVPGIPAFPKIKIKKKDESNGQQLDRPWK